MRPNVEGSRSKEPVWIEMADCFPLAGKEIKHPEETHQRVSWREWSASYNLESSLRLTVSKDWFLQSTAESRNSARPSYLVGIAGKHASANHQKSASETRGRTSVHMPGSAPAKMRNHRAAGDRCSTATPCGRKRWQWRTNASLVPSILEADFMPLN